MWKKIKNIYHFFIASLANFWHGSPSKNLIVIGITGTDGKTTTASLIHHILKSSGFSSSIISSIGAEINGRKYPLPFHVTTPPPFALQKFIKRAVAFKEKSYLVLEVTSHSLDQQRVFGINFEIGVITNITREHLDYHKTYENYIKAKTKLLEMSRIAVLNQDDESYELIKKELGESKKIKIITYGSRKSSDINPIDFKYKSKLLGQFNKYNILAGIAVCVNLGIKKKKIINAVGTFNPPLGRQDIVYPSAGSGQGDFTVMIDFAHTPNSFLQILKVLRKKVKGRIIHVFGAAGQRDALKRPEMGKISSEYSDIVIVTSEDPRSERIEKITDEIIAGIDNRENRIKNKTLLRISDRQKAITEAIKMAKRDDLVLLTGKSHEKSINYGLGEEPWDEFEAAKEAIESRSMNYESRTRIKNKNLENLRLPGVSS